MRVIVRTIYGAHLQTARRLGLPYELMPNSTLTEIANSGPIPAFRPTPLTSGMEYPAPYNYLTDSNEVKLQYFCIGNGGHRPITDGTVVSNSPPTVHNGVAYMSPVPHKSTDAGFYNWIPFVAKPVDADLTLAERAKYRMRVTMLIDGTLYAVYYARILDITSVVPELLLTTVTNGSAVPSTFESTLSDLYPEQPAIATTTTGSFVSVSANVEITFTQEEVLWLKEAAELLFGDANAAVISEIGICQGVDKPITQRYPTSGVQSPVAVNNPQLREAVAVQVGTFISRYYSPPNVTDGFTLRFNLGATEPLFGV